jgi:hypothetical protein
MDPDGVWVTVRGEGQFRRDQGQWKHAYDAGAWRDLAVPGARDVTMDELHGHRIRDLHLDRHPWPLSGEVRYVRLADAHEYAELAWARTPHRLRHRTLGTLCGFAAAEWESRRSKIVGLWAPELVRNDVRGALAATGLNERAAARDARSAAGYRRALMRRGAKKYGLSHRRLATAAGISRGRVDQILREPDLHGGAAAASARSIDEVLERLAVATSKHREEKQRLDEARHARAAAVQEARRLGLSLAQIAHCLGVSRGRVQQLARP